MIPTTDSNTSIAFRDSPPTALDSRDAIIILLIAMILGSALRFYRLGVEEMNRGEAAAWMAAVAPNLQAVFMASKVLDPGKSGIYDIVLHLWIAGRRHPLRSEERRVASECSLCF